MPGHPQDDTNPNFFPDSNSPILGLSNEVSFVLEILKKTIVTVKMRIFSKMTSRLYSHVIHSLVPINHLLGHSNEVSFVSELCWKDG